MTAAGWYDEPGNASIERYWDGTQWTPQTRPAGAEAATSLELGPTGFEQHMATYRANTATVCATGPCSNSRLPDSYYCADHQPKKNNPLTTSRPATSAPSGTAALVCPHCQVQGRVTSKQVKLKKGVSGGKLTGAVLTAGISMLGTGLSRKEKVTEMRCGSCRTVWHV